MAQLATVLLTWGKFDRPVLDQTGLDGKFDYNLEWAPEASPDPVGDSILESIKDQLGLKLESKKGPVEILVIDHIEHPSPN